MKKYHHPYDLPISSLLSFWFILQMFLKSALVTQILPMCIHLKIYVTIIYSFSEFLLENFDIFKCFYSYWCCLIKFFLKHFQGRTSHIFKTKKPKKTEDRQYIGSIVPSRITNSCKRFKPNKPKEQLSFQKDKNFGQFSIIGYLCTSFKIIHFIHQPHFLQGGLPSRFLYSLCYSESPIIRKKNVPKFCFTIIVHISQTRVSAIKFII